MKRNIFSWGLMLGALSLASCQKDNLEQSGPDAGQNTIVRTLSVSGEEWQGAESRSGYNPGEGVKLDGTETISVYYSAYKEGQTEAAGMQGPEIATPQGGGNYSFSHAEIADAAAYNYYFVMPHLATSGKNSAGSSSYHRLSPVQLPQAASFDPNFDYLLGQAQENVPLSQQLNVAKFKRFFTPLRFDLTDGANVLGGEKIRSVAVAFGNDASQAQSVAGLFYAAPSTDYAGCTISFEKVCVSNALTALYPQGLAAVSGTYPVWYIVRPTELAAGSLHVTVSTDTKTVTRIVDLPALSVREYKINSLGIDISGAGYAVENSITQDFSTFSNVNNPALAASDGNTYTWGFTDCVAWSDTKSTLPNALQLKPTANNAVELPELKGATITKVRIVEHANNGSSGTLTDNQLYLNAGDVQYGPYAFNYYGDLAQDGGVCEIEIPAEAQGSPLTISKSTADTKTTLIGSITLVYSGEIVRVDTNDYYDMYQKGYDIPVGDMVVNKDGYPSATVVTTAAQLKTAINNTGGLIFVDVKGALDADLTTPTAKESTVIIGRWVDSQPQISMPGATYIAVRCPEGIFACKNIAIDNPDANYLFATNGFNGQIYKIVLEDCTFAIKSNLVNDAAADHWISNTMINNSIIKYYGTASGKALYYAAGNQTGKIGTAAELQNITLTNNVVYAVNTPSDAIKLCLVFVDTATSKYETKNADFKVSNNTIYNMWHGNGMLTCYQAKSIEFSNNVGVLDGVTAKKSTYCVGYGGDTPKTDGVTVDFSNNQCYSNDATNKWKNYWQSKTKTEALSDVTTSNPKSDLALDENPLDIDINSPTTQGDYLPVKAGSAAAAAGAGATYDTKKWNTWK